MQTHVLADSFNPLSTGGIHRCHSLLMWFKWNIWDNISLSPNSIVGNNLKNPRTSLSGNILTNWLPNISLCRGSMRCGRVSWKSWFRAYLGILVWIFTLCMIYAININKFGIFLLISLLFIILNMKIYVIAIKKADLKQIKKI